MLSGLLAAAALGWTLRRSRSAPTAPAGDRLVAHGVS